MIKFVRNINKLYLNRRINLFAIIIVVIVSGVLYTVLLRNHKLCGFYNQISYLLTSQMMTAKEVLRLSTVFQQLQDTLQERWPGSEVVPLGSATTGLSMKFSDADCMITLPHHNIYNATMDKYLISEAVRLLKKYPELYENVRMYKSATNPISILKFDFIPTRRNCDVNFINTHGLQISRMLAYYYSLDDRVITVAAIIKLWSITDWRKKTSMLTSYTLNLLIIFYFQQEEILPPFYIVQNRLVRGVPDSWRNSNTKNTYELLRGFFNYYNEFDYEKHVVSVLYGRTIIKQDFGGAFRIPKKISSYSQNKEHYVSSVSDRKLYVQDAIPPHDYVLEPVPSQVLIFKSRINDTVVMFQRIPSDRILGTILRENINADIFKGKRLC